MIETVTNKVVVYIAMSLDGYIAKSDGDISWLSEFQLEDEDYGYQNFIDEVGFVIIGGNSYKKVSSFDEWPYKQKVYVLAHNELPKVTQNMEFYDGSLKDLITTLKTTTDKNIYVDGGAKAVQSFLKEGLIDEMIITIIPKILGGGISLFGGLNKNINLVLRLSKTFRNGVVQVNYVVDKNN